MMKKSKLLGIFLRSLSVQVSFNFWRMQNLGFAFAMLPVIRPDDGDRTRLVSFLAGHLEMFNTHPYMVAPVIGAVVRIEEEGRASEAADLKKALMGPFAAIGDSFFWGALRSFSAVGSVIVAFMGFLAAPIVFLVLYSPSHFWIRLKGFIEGYRKGKSVIDFIRNLDLPGTAARIRSLLPILIGILAAAAVDMACGPRNLLPEIAERAAALGLLLLFCFGIHRGITPVQILYGMTLLCMVVSF